MTSEIHPVVVDILTALVVPFLVSLLKDVNWSPNTKLLLTFVVSLLAALVSLWFSGTTFDAENIAQSTAVIFSVATAIYRFLLERTGLNTTLESIKVL